MALVVRGAIGSASGLPSIRALLLVGVLASGITLVGMGFFLFRFDDSKAVVQLFWFVIMLFPILGAALYCFFSYSRSEILEGTALNEN